MLKKSISKRFFSFFMVMVMVLGALFVASPVTVLAVGTTYYVDSLSGNNNNNGTDPSTPWQTLSKVNGTTFQPGDQILFKGGCTFTGTLHPLGSGNSSNQIIIDKYGTGKPKIDGNGNDYAIFLGNQQYWTIQNLEIINEDPDTSAEELRSGVYIKGDSAGTLNKIYLYNLDIHDVFGYTDENGPGGSGYPNYYWNAGIFISIMDCNLYPSTVFLPVPPDPAETNNGLDVTLFVSLLGPEHG